MFADDVDRAWLEALLWPLVAERVEAFRAEASLARAAAGRGRRRGAAALRGRRRVALRRDDRGRRRRRAARAQRVAARDQAELARREARQLPQAEKARRATFVVANDGSRDELRERLRGVLAEIAS